MIPSMRIAILTSGRFHVCDLARELHHQGHEVSFISCVPKSVTNRFGLPEQCNKSLFWALAPLFVLMRKSQGSRFRNSVDRLFITALDSFAARVIPKCDVFIGMSGMSRMSATAARSRFGSKIWIERGSRHIQSQKAILDALPGTQRIPSFTVDRELADYALADTIAIPSLHVEQSFLEAGVRIGKLFRNPYGVDLTMFPTTASPAKSPPTILMVGNWSLRKGCDLLGKAWSQLPGTRLIHVGNISDAPLPIGADFQHFDAVPQSRLGEFYANAHVFALPSREEGLAVVQCQALSSGLRIVCSDRSGGEDLQEFTERPDRISVVPNGNLESLTQALRENLNAAVGEIGPRNFLGAGRDRLSWRQYGARYSAELTRRTVAGA